MDQQTQPPRLPPPKAAGLTNILNEEDRSHGRNGSSHHPAPPHLRDSGFYSTADASSKHTSAASFSNDGLSPTNSGYQSTVDKTPSPTATNTVPYPVVSPSGSNMSVAAMVSPSSSGTERRFERPALSLAESSYQNGATLGEGLASSAAPRRESVDSRINQNFSDMRLGGSPYASNNQSTSSIQNTLHSQRNPRPGLDSLSVHRISNGYQPNAERNPEPKTGRTAPAITGPATGHIARAAEPTKGQAWAFPEEEIQRVGGPVHYESSRRSSLAESVTSSQFTTESRLPPGQRRLDDGIDYPRMSNASSEFPPVHHHTMQHKQLTDLQADALGGPSGSQPYSRTPELRVSHKLAERKRRTEMKELFDQLRDLMPQERGSKASKWEILTKAISEHQRLLDHSRAVQSHYNTVVAENDALRRENENMFQELQRHRMDGGHQAQSHQAQPHQTQQHQAQQHQSQAQEQHPPRAVQPQQLPPPPTQARHSSAQPNSYASDSYAHPNRQELPPIRSLNGGMSNGPDSMTGVQYEAPRRNSYRPPERY